MKRSRTTAISTSSMADIAFLLLVFFLVVTRINDEKGLMFQLPPVSDNVVHKTPESELFIRLTGEGDLIVDNLPGDMETLISKLDEHFLPDPDLSVVYLAYDPSCPYQHYIAVLDQLKHAYRLSLEILAMEQYGKSMKSMKREELIAFKQRYPLRLNELGPGELSANKD